MPAVRTSSNSTTRRINLADFIDAFGDTMVQKCSTCVKHNRVCKVHLRSGRCNNCNRMNQKCDVKVTQSEFRRLTEEKQKLKRQIDEALSAQADALEALRTARAREERLRQQMDLTDRRAAEAIAVESRALEETLPSRVSLFSCRLPLGVRWKTFRMVSGKPLWIQRCWSVILVQPLHDLSCSGGTRRLASAIQSVR
jgi:hypothetical protein